MNDYPRGFAPMLLGVFAATWLSGLLLGPTTLALRAQWELPWRLGGAGRLGAAALHVAAAFVLLFFAGALWSLHMRRGWQRRRRRGSGGALAGLLALLAFSALGLFYAGDEGLANGAAYLHLAAGIALLGLLARHALRAGRWRRRFGGRGPGHPPSGQRSGQRPIWRLGLRHRSQSRSCSPGAPAEKASAGSALR
ncbi:MAG TPA: hypothetical protein PLW24_02620 [Burkholderiaceae bacterium]|nr:hypothetical protein [Burkholderiaceae bacterium]HNG78335.1 hypothetical protein [Burkholderiaceae bacterium]